VVPLEDVHPELQLVLVVLLPLARLDLDLLVLQELPAEVSLLQEEQQLA